MNVRLALAGVLLRGRWHTRWLQRIDGMVVQALLPLLGGEGADLSSRKEGRSSRPAEYRRQMAVRHAQLVDALVSHKGREGALEEGRRVLFEAGSMMGRDLRSRLRLSGDPEEFLAAARLLYRMLGIEFQVEMQGREGTMKVVRCSLSQGYGPLTCDVISAMDEGVVSGLDPQVSMRFETRNRPGTPCCTARIAWEGRS